MTVSLTVGSSDSEELRHFDGFLRQQMCELRNERTQLLSVLILGEQPVKRGGNLTRQRPGCDFILTRLEGQDQVTRVEITIPVPVTLFPR